MAPTFIRLRTVLKRTGLSRSSIYLRIAQGTFPRAVSLGERAVGWIEAEVDDWISTRIEKAERCRVVNTSNAQGRRSQCALY